MKLPKNDLHRKAASKELEKDITTGTRTLVIGPYFIKAQRNRTLSAGSAWSLSVKGEGAGNSRSVESRLEEASGLAAAIDVAVVEAQSVVLQTIRPATYIGKGKVEEFRVIIENSAIELVVMDCALSPVQQRNLEKAWNAKVIDRTGLILEIFGHRAHTKEGILQVELAHLAYQKGRLVRTWTHLERQRGGFGFLGGPGETQIEADRRMIQERMNRIEHDLETVVQTRSLHRSKRKRVPYPVIALVGYTNAGKSSLFNRMTQAEVLAEDMLFATLDPTTRAIRLPHGGQAILSDTVGFISDLPTTLVAAFRATLEDVVEADILLHVRDISHGESDAQAQDVETVLDELGITEEKRSNIIEVWNKADLLSEADRILLSGQYDRHRKPGKAAILLSASTGEGLDRLYDAIEARITGSRPVYVLTIAAENGKAVAWLHGNTEVLDKRFQEDSGTMTIAVRVAPEKEGRLLHQFPNARRRG